MTFKRYAYPDKQIMSETTCTQCKQRQNKQKNVPIVFEQKSRNIITDLVL